MNYFGLLLVFMLYACDFKAEDLTENYSYSLSETFCETGKHSFSTLNSYCSALQNESLNNNCARSQRQDLFHSKCSGSFIVAEKASTPTGCQITIRGKDQSFPDCFEKSHGNGYHVVKPEILNQIDFKKTKDKWVTYSDFNRTQTDNKIFPTIVKGYILPDGRAQDVVFFDNGADYFEEGLARFISDNGKVGFVNENLDVMIPPTHDYVTPFDAGLAYFCDGCELEKSNKEHKEIIGGLWGMMDKKGKTVKGPGPKEKFLKF